jgi:hypothetical protein
VKTRDGSSYSFDYVINTLPIGVMQRSFDTLFPAGLFSPMKRAGLFKFRMVRGGRGGGIQQQERQPGLGCGRLPHMHLCLASASALLPGDCIQLHAQPDEL